MNRLQFNLLAIPFAFLVGCHHLATGLLLLSLSLLINIVSILRQA